MLSYYARVIPLQPRYGLLLRLCKTYLSLITMPNSVENSDVNLTFLISDANQFAHHVLVRYDRHDAPVCQKSGLREALQLKHCWELHLQNTPEFCIVQ